MNDQRATCPACRRVIPIEDINVANDIALCRDCGVTHRFSDLIASADDDRIVSEPPAGTWHRQEGNAMIIGTTHRSIGLAVCLLAFGLFWNGVVSVFLAGVTASTLQHLGWSLPRWLPMAFADHSMPLGLTIFLWVFLTPFIAVGLFLLAAFVSCLAGRTEIRLENGAGTLFTGVGELGFRRRFAVAEVKEVRIEDRSWRDSDGDRRRNVHIVIETNRKPIRFGSMLSDERRQFVAAALKRELVRR